MADGYGIDAYCWDELRTGRLVSGAELVAQAIYRRLTTPRGTLRDGDDGDVYGFDLLDFIGKVGSKAAIDVLPGAVVAEVLKDDRVSSATCVITASVDTAGMVALAVTVDVTLRDEGDGFTLTLDVSDAAVAFGGFSTT